MKKAEWEQALKDELCKIPIENRKTWDDVNLMTWYFELIESNPRLKTFDGVVGDPWQRVKGVCAKLITHRALR